MSTEIKNALHSAFKNTAEMFISVRKESGFLTEGVLTPEEFVQSGDLLVYKCPTWAWAAGDPKRAVDYLPPDKQFLITRSVPCKTRFKDDSTVGEEMDDEWLAVGKESNENEEVKEIEVKGKTQEKQVIDDDDDDDDIVDAEGFDVENNLIEPDPEAANNDVGETIARSRTYDISITYDKYYQTPKIWLFGYSESGKPLSAAEIFMDISEDHAKKTVTLEPHPHIGIPYAFIHPCKHAAVMKKFITRMIEKGKQPRVDQYLLLFLKFMSVVMPTIAYDNTFEIEL